MQSGINSVHQSRTWFHLLKYQDNESQKNELKEEKSIDDIITTK